MTGPHQRHFLGWEKPVLHAACDWLSGMGRTPLLDLSHWLVVVPTQQAGRRLREHLAQRTQGQCGGVVPPQVRTPQSLIAMGHVGQPVASREVMLAVWVEVLRSMPQSSSPHLFPGADSRRDLQWAMSCANRFLKVQHLLGEKGLSISDLANGVSLSLPLEEPERWRELSHLETQVIALLDTMDLADPTRANALAARGLLPPVGISQVAVIAVPDPIPLAVTALEALQSRLPVNIVIHAPPSLAHAFDDWGRPRPEIWGHLPLPLEDSDISLVGGPAEMGQAVLDSLSQKGIASSDLVVGVPDPSVVPHVSKAFFGAGLATYDPAGLPLANHPLVVLLEQVAQLRDGGQYTTLATLLRQPDYLRLLQREMGTLSVEMLLAQLDQVQNELLPSVLSDINRHFARGPNLGGKTLRQALTLLQGHLESLGHGQLGHSMLQFLARVYASKELHLERQEDRAFQAAAKAISKLLYRLDLPLYEQLSLSPSERFTLLRQSLGGLAYYVDREVTAIDLLGWLELHWDDAPWAIITGMNDGHLPESVVGDAFLPDSLRQAIGIACNSSRFGRDAYLLHAIISCRNSPTWKGGVQVVVGRTTESGDPLRPSRLLFLCPDEMLAPRVKRLFQELPPRRKNPVAPARWLLRPPVGALPEVLSPTALRDYLTCPFRFYLKRVLGMERVDDRVRELDPMQFGVLCHEALEAMGSSSALSQDATEIELANFLEDALNRRVKQWFGHHVPVAVQVQLDAARQRLRWAARAEAAERANGWRIVSVESSLGAQRDDTVGGFPLRGRIDRLDQHKDGRWRILDYKTRERSRAPFDTHLRKAREDTPDWLRVPVGDQEYEWVDLQLPLYAHFVGRTLDGPVDAGVFELPGAVSDTRVSLFEELTPALRDSAVACANAAAQAIADWQFWPPRRVNYDDFEALLGANPLTAVDHEYFLAMLEEQRQVKP